MKALLVLAAVVVILRVARPVLVLHTMLRWRFWRPRARLVNEDEVARHVHEGLRTPIAELEALGFQHLGWLANERDLPVLLRWQARLFHSGVGAYASVMFASTPDPVMPWAITLASVGEDGQQVRTYGAGERSLLGEPTHTVVVCPYEPSLSRQWEAHRNAVRAAGLVPAKLSHDEVFARSRDQGLAHFDSLVQSGTLLPGGDSVYVCSWRAALRTSKAVLQTMPRLKAQRVQREGLLRASLQPLPVVPLEEEVAAYERFRLESGGPPRKSFLLALFAVTVPLFVLAGSLYMGAATTAALVLAIVLFHELGHYVAMRALGYVDTTIFFVPFLGGVAAGRNEEATLTQRMIVLSAGPLPGLVIAIAMVFVPQFSGTSFRDGLVLVAAINLFNLLPMLPLDGGQIAHMLLFARRPWLDVTFRAFAGVGLILLGLTASAAFLGVLGVLALVQLPKSWQQSKLRQQYREARLAWPDEPALRLFFRVLRTTPLASAPFGNKVLLARMTLEQAKVDAPLRPAALLGWLSAYGSAFATGCVAVFLAFGTSTKAVAEPFTPGRVENSAPIACPAPPSNEPAASPSPRYAQLAGVGIFDTADTFTADARARLGATSSVAVFRSVGPALFVWSATTANDQDDDIEDISTAMTARETATAAALRAAGARYYARESAIPVIECTGPDDDAARRLSGAVEDYQAVIRRTMAIPAPWASGEKPTEAQALARRTFRVAMKASEGAPYTPPRASWLSALLKTGTKRRLSDFRAQRLRAVETALAAQRATGSIDEEVARLAIARVSAPPDEWARFDDELSTHLGATSMRPRDRPTLGMRVSQTGPRVRFELDSLQPRDVDSEVLPLLSWLCAESCESRLLLESRQGE